jgi:hypothetical protein
MSDVTLTLRSAALVAHDTQVLATPEAFSAVEVLSALLEADSAVAKRSRVMRTGIVSEVTAWDHTIDRVVRVLSLGDLLRAYDQLRPRIPAAVDHLGPHLIRRVIDAHASPREVLAILIDFANSVPGMDPIELEHLITPACRAKYCHGVDLGTLKSSTTRLARRTRALFRSKVPGSVDPRYYTALFAPSRGSHPVREAYLASYVTSRKAHLNAHQRELALALLEDWQGTLNELLDVVVVIDDRAARR